MILLLMKVIIHPIIWRNVDKKTFFNYCLSVIESYSYSNWDYVVNCDDCCCDWTQIVVFVVFVDKLDTRTVKVEFSLTDWIFTYIYIQTTNNLSNRIPFIFHIKKIFLTNDFLKYFNLISQLLVTESKPKYLLKLFPIENAVPFNPNPPQPQPIFLNINPKTICISKIFT